MLTGLPAAQGLLTSACLAISPSGPSAPLLPLLTLARRTSRFCQEVGACTRAFKLAAAPMLTGWLQAASFGRGLVSEGQGRSCSVACDLTEAANRQLLLAPKVALLIAWLLLLPHSCLHC